MTASKVLLRIDPTVHDALARWAADEFRSLNAHVERIVVARRQRIRTV